MATYVWQRSHGSEIIAEVIADARGWRPSTWKKSQPTGVVLAKTPRVSRQAACAKADELARRAFDHACDATTCGDWVPYEPEI